MIQQICIQNDAKNEKKKPFISDKRVQLVLEAELKKKCEKRENMRKRMKVKKRSDKFFGGPSTNRNHMVIFIACFELFALRCNYCVAYVSSNRQYHSNYHVYKSKRCMILLLFLWFYFVLRRSRKKYIVFFLVDYSNCKS